MMQSPTTRRHLLAVSIAACSLLALPAGSVFAAPGSALNLAMVAEPQTLDPMASTADLVATIMQHVYEPLYTFDAKWQIVPLLADSLPKVSEDGKQYTITLRKGVMLHNGRELNAEDVIASLKRWMEMAPRGKNVAAELASLNSKGDYSIEIVLKQPYAPLLAQLALPSGMAAIMAKESIANPLTQFVGTGPYKFAERKPDQYVLLTRFDKYSARKEGANGYGGKRNAMVNELRFIPVPNANTRVEGALAGQYHFADLLPVDALPRLEKARDKTVPALNKSFGFPYLVLNTKEGSMAKPAVRQALQTALNQSDMLAAGFGNPQFYTTEGNHFPKGTPFYSTAGLNKYRQNNPAQARSMAAAAGYQGEPVRILTSRQYDFHYNMALIMAEQLKKAGFKPDLNVVDWATLVQRRNDSKLWDIYITHSPLFPEPMLSPPQLGNGAPGWWSTPAKQAALDAFNEQTDPAKRAAAWGRVQQTVYDEVPYIQVGKFSSLSSRSPKLEGFTASTWPFFWNVKLKP